MSNTHIVTALLEMGRDTLSTKYSLPFKKYVKSLERLATLKLPMTIHADVGLHGRLLNRRTGEPTTLVPLNAEILQALPEYELVQSIRVSTDWLARDDWIPESPQAALPLYNPLVLQKLRWVADAARQGDSEHDYLWVDAGLHKHLQISEHHYLNEQYLSGLVHDSDKVFMFAIPYEEKTEIHGFPRDAMARYCHTDFVDRCCRGGIFGGGASAILQLEKHYTALMTETLEKGLMGTEESLLTILSYRYPELIEVRLLPPNFIPAMFGQQKSFLRKVRKTIKSRSVGAEIGRVTRREMAHQKTRLIHQPMLPRIRKLPPWSSVEEPVLDLHMLLCARDVEAGMWALRSFLYFSELSVRLYVHDDGSLGESQVAQLETMFPQMILIPFSAASEEMSRALARYPNAYRYRITEYSWPAIKLLDFAHYSEGRRFMVLDADVLFFKRPVDLLDALAEDQGFFMSDCKDAYTWPLSRWPAVLGIEGVSRVNVGLFSMLRDDYDLALVDEYLAAYYQRSPCPRGYWLEQTIWAALFSSQLERMIRLPDTYQIADTLPLTDSTISHHFVKDASLSRLNFSRQGIPALVRSGFLTKVAESE